MIYYGKRVLKIHLSEWKHFKSFITQKINENQNNGIPEYLSLGIDFQIEDLFDDMIIGKDYVTITIELDDDSPEIEKILFEELREYADDMMSEDEGYTKFGFATCESTCDWEWDEFGEIDDPPFVTVNIDDNRGYYDKKIKKGALKIIIN